MISFFHLYERFEIIGENFLVGGDFENGIAQSLWRQLGKVEWEKASGWDGSPAVKISTGNGKTGLLGCSLGDPSDYKYLLCRGDLRSENVVRGDRPWSIARLLLYFRDSDGDALWREPHEVQQLAGSEGWKSYSRVFQVPSNGVTAHVSVVNNGASGVLWADNIELFPAQQKRTFMWWRVFFGGLWLAALIYGIWQIRLWQWELGVLIFVVAFLLILGLLVPSSTISNVAQREEAISGTLVGGAKALSRLARSSLTSTEQPLIKAEKTDAGDKGGSERSAEIKIASLTKHVTLLKGAGHFMLFAILAFVSYVSLDRRLSQGPRPQHEVGSATSTVVGQSKTDLRPLLILGLGLIVFSAATEVLQFLVLTRTPRIRDWLFDLAGICLSFVLFLVYRYLKLRYRSQKQGSVESTKSSYETS
jgi:hypothetical protein